MCDSKYVPQVGDRIRGSWCYPHGGSVMNIISIAGMEHNPNSFLARVRHDLQESGRPAGIVTAWLVESDLSGEPIDRDQAIALVESLGYQVDDVLHSMDPPMTHDDGIILDALYSVTLWSTVSDAEAVCKVRGADIPAFVADMESSGWWACVNYHAIG